MGVWTIYFFEKVFSWNILVSTAAAIKFVAIPIAWMSPVKCMFISFHASFYIESRGWAVAKDVLRPKDFCCCNNFKVVALQSRKSLKQTAPHATIWKVFWGDVLYSVLVMIMERPCGFRHRAGYSWWVSLSLITVHNTYALLFHYVRPNQKESFHSHVEHSKWYLSIILVIQFNNI